MAFIEIKHLTHVFKSNDEKKDGLKALDDINLNIDKGEFIAVIGVNGSGKSTLAKHLNGLLLPTEGACFVDGIKVEDSEEIWKVRQKVSMVFQNPDNQIIATIVEDDIAFGPENMGLPREEIRKRVEFALQSLHIEHLRKFAPHLLSGGQKQLTAIAGAIAMRTNCLILDEPTAMLDPQGRIAVMNALKELHEKYNMTIIMITHFMEEAMQAQRIVVMDNGKIVQDGTPEQIFADRQKLRSLGLEVPLSVDMAAELKKRGVKIAGNVFTTEQLVAELEKIVLCQ
ncbi:energy-coupling factor transporter ATPase [Megamonas hypermegale]|uniref:energy-coupling factor transporter ATPase n=1 Tax=Megamonas hypermegale TaxID=158847 RepID=UPI0026EB53C2|nr:energy-coupling factor transporter ATPase [Megamonas hypermegale]